MERHALGDFFLLQMLVNHNRLCIYECAAMPSEQLASLLPPPAHRTRACTHTKVAYARYAQSAPASPAFCIKPQTQAARVQHHAMPPQTDAPSIRRVYERARVRFYALVYRPRVPAQSKSPGNLCMHVDSEITNVRLLVHGAWVAGASAESHARFWSAQRN